MRRCVTFRGSIVWFPRIQCRYFRDAGFWNDKKNQREFLDQFRREHNIEKPEDWAKVYTKQIRDAGGTGLLTKYPSFFTMLQTIYPEYKWDIFSNVRQLPRNFWSHKPNQRLFLEHLADKLEIKELDDWKKVTEPVLKREGGSGLLAHYSNVHKALDELYPKKSWNVFTSRKRLSNEFWKLRENQYKFLEYLAQVKGIESLDDWYSISAKDFKEHGGFSLLLLYPCMAEIFIQLFPDHCWDISKFQKTPGRLWRDVKYQRVWLERLREKLGLLDVAEWQQYSANTIIEHGGRGLVSQYNSFMEMLQAVYPEHKWDLLRQKRVSKTYFDSMENQRLIIDQIMEKYNIEPEKLQEKHFRHNSGSSLLARYPSIPKMLQSVYPEKDWTFLLEDTSRADYWKSRENQKKFFNKVKEHYQIQSFFEWKKVSITKFLQLGGSELLKQHKSLSKALSVCYPKTDWSFLDKEQAENYWACEDNQRLFFYELASVKRITLHESWHEITMSDVNRLGGHWITKQYSCVYLALCHLFPSHSWNILEANSLPSELYEDCKIQRELLDRIGKELCYTSEEDWLQVTQSLLIKMKAGRLLSQYSSIHDMLASVYPTKDWSCFQTLSQSEPVPSAVTLVEKPIEVPEASDTANEITTITNEEETSLLNVTVKDKLPRDFLEKISHQRAYLDTISQHLGIHEQESWLHVTESQIKSFPGGKKLLTKYASVYEMVSSLFPEKDWEFFSLQSGRQAGYWNNLANQRKKMDQIGQQLQITSPDHWKQVTLQKFESQAGGSEILMRYGSLYKALCVIYPEEDWKLFEFCKRLPRGYWNSIDNQREFIEHVGKQIGAKEWHDWYSISFAILRAHGGWFLSQSYSSMYHMMRSLVPEYTWDPLLFKSANSLTATTKEAQLECMEQIARQLQLQSVSDWQNVPVSQFVKEGGAGILKQYENYYHMLQSLFPNEKWDVTKIRIPHGFFDKMENQRAYLDQISEKLNLEDSEDWLRVYESHIRSFAGGKMLLQKYDGLYDMLSCIYPDRDWECFSKQKNSPSGYWNKLENQRKLMDGIVNALGVTKPCDWRDISTQLFMEQAGADEILRRHASLFDALCAIYPEKKWNIFETRSRIPNSFLDDPNCQREFLEYAFKQLGLKTWEDWYSVSVQQIRELGGAPLLSRYGKLHQILQRVYPENDWKLYLFHERPAECVRDSESHRYFIEEFAKKHGVKKKEDWGNIKIQDFKRDGGTWLLAIYGDIFSMLEANFPEESWNLLESRRSIPMEYWEDPNNVSAWVKKFEEEYAIQQPEEWYRVSHLQIRKEKGGGLLMKYGNLHQFLSAVYPHVEWNASMLQQHSKRATQRRLFILIRRLFPHEEVIEEFRSDEEERDSGYSLELDIFIPHKSLAFEYNGRHHYEEVAAWCGIELQKNRDKEKQEICHKLGINLVVIPYWWDQSMASLLEEMQEQGAGEMIPPSFLPKE